MSEHVDYATIAAAVAPTGMVARGGFVVDPTPSPVPPAADGRPVPDGVVIGNVGGVVWPGFRAAETPGPHPLDRWTRSTLRPIAARVRCYLRAPE